MYNELKALEEFESEDFDLGRPGDQEGYMAAEQGGSYEEEFEFENFDNFGEGGQQFDQYADNFGDLEGFGEGKGEGGYGEFENEGEEFFGKIWKAAKKVGGVLAPLAKKFAPQIGSVIGGALGGPAGAAIGGKLGGFVKSMESEDEGETEDEMNATSEVPATESQLSEAVAIAASRGRPIDAQSMGSAITIFVGQRAPMRVKTVLPVLAQASGDVARMLVSSRDPRARALIRTLPAIQKRTIATLTKKAQSGKPVTPQIAVRVMAKHANRTLSNPTAISKALATNVAAKRAIDRKAVGRAERFY